jgi:UDP-3-O-[3-hydroxymyristoyl] glucosamine N-acyltransferase
MRLNVQLDTLLEVLGQGSCSVDRSFLINNVASLESAGPSDLAIVLDRGDKSVFENIGAQKIKNSSAGLILASRPIVGGKPYLFVNDPLVAYQKIVQYAKKLLLEERGRLPGPLHKFVQISSLARVAESATLDSFSVISFGTTIGRRTFVGAHVFVGENCSIGDDVILYPGVKVLDRCVIGNGSIVHAGSVIGSDGFGYQVSSKGLKKIPQIGIVEVRKNVEIGANCSIDRGSFDATTIEDCVKIDNNVHIAHNVKIGRGTVILAQSCIGGSVTIGVGCQIGGQVAIKNNIKIGRGAKIISKSAVMNDIKDEEIVAGLPAISFNKWKRMVVVLAKLPEMFKELREVIYFVKQTRGKKTWFQKLFWM